MHNYKDNPFHAGDVVIVDESHSGSVVGQEYTVVEITGDGNSDHPSYLAIITDEETGAQCTCYWMWHLKP